ncbi:hypothetical protein Leryth_023322 [Lithospermum erythrorhizon]|uniref:Uncharacterized protein n=1 Tax=Lithospermum erythrorhizon TaxID=34254 RepID=A0AAV3QU02_LITER|nr:hypothetical protein Leryth_023322 [Lithospermum erythrorhizon]
MSDHKMFRLCVLIFLSLALFNLSEARQQKKHASAVLVGSVYCDTCFHQSFSKASHFISGADVAVECSVTNTTPNFKKVVSTNEHGEFRIHLPFSVSKHVKKIKRCSVKLIKSSEPFCAVASSATSSALHLKSRKEGNHIFSAGFFTFKPLNQPELCGQKPSVQESNKFESQKSSITNPKDPRYLPPIENPPSSNQPPLVIDLPLLPPLTSLPAIPFLPPLPRKASTTKGSTRKSELSNQKVAQTNFFGPNNPFRPPSLFPPIIPSPPTSTFPPTIPSPPTSIFPPILPSPSTSPPSLFPPGNLPPTVPGLLPPPPVFRFPFQPLPGFPGAPPAVKSVSSQNSSP